MAAIDFPNSPTLNQEFTAGTTIYKWNGTVWEVKQSTLSSSSFSDTNPIMNSSASAGTSLLASRSDHVHPSDTSKASVTDLSTHTSATTSVHGISNTANLVYTNDSRLTDSRTPTAHASSHGSAGSDAITIAQSQVTNLTTDLSAKAPLASPALTGTPTAPTAAAATNTTQIATTAFVRTEVSNLVASAPSALDTLNELATALGNDPNFATTITNSLSTKAPINSPTFTGTPLAPTAAAGTNTTQIATTAFTASAITTHNASSGVHGVTGTVVGTTDSQTLTNKTLSANILLSPEERCNVVAAAATGTINFDVLTSTIWFYTSNAAADHTLNFRGNSGTTLNSVLAVGDSISLIWLNTNGGTAYRPTAFQIDGVSVTPRWSGGTAPSAGNANSVDAYSFSIIKTAATPTYTVLAGQTRFA